MSASGMRTSRSASGADYEHSKIAQIDRELAADGAQESFAISIRSDQFLIANANCVYGSYATRRFIRLVDLRETRDFVRHRQIHSREIQISQKTQSRAQFVRADMKTSVLGVDFTGAQGGILYVWRKRVGDWIAKDAQANRWINIARNLTPLLKIGECVTLRGLQFFHVIQSSSVCPSLRSG